MMIKLNQKPHLRQQKSKKRPFTPTSVRKLVRKDFDELGIPKLQKRVEHRLRHYLESMPSTQRQGLNIIVAHSIQNKYTYIGQQRIADAIGVHRTTVNKSFVKLEAWGFFNSFYRHRKTSVYVLANIFKESWFIKKFAYLLPALLLLNANPFTPNRLVSSKLYLKDKEIVSLYSKSGTQSNKNSYDLLFSRVNFNLNTSGVVMNDVREAIEAITEIQLSDIGKAKLAVFPSKTIQLAHVKLKKSIPERRADVNPFSVLLRACKDVSPEVDTSHHNPLFQALGNKMGFKFNDSPLLGTQISIPKKGPPRPNEYDQTVLAKKARAVQSKYDNSCPKPNHGDPITDKQIQAYALRTTGRRYVYPRRRKQ